MHQEKYNLNWHTYSDHLKEMLHDMMKTDELTDVTLVCDDKRQLKAHKIVLSACSSVFKNIIQTLPEKASVIYLRGIQHQEMESILEFMYMGVATFYQERMNDFLNVAKNLEIKEISKDLEFDEQFTDNDNPDLEIPQNRVDCESEVSNDPPNELVNRSGDKNTYNYETTKHNSLTCNTCNLIFTRKQCLTRHIQSIHEGGKYACNQCDKQFTAQHSLTIHIQSIHEGVKYDCNQCDQQFTIHSHLKRHIRSIHEGVKYACKQCDQQFKHPEHLKVHIKSIHEGVKYSCNQCDKLFTQQANLTTHIKSKH